MIENKKIQYENTIIIGVVNKNQSETIVNDYLDELTFLSETAGGVVKKRFIQKLESPNPKTFIGSGKIIEVQAYNKKNDISSVIFDDELSPTQQGNLEKILRCKIIDRTGLILDIFAQRAQTSYAKNQVELAQYQYLMPRLKGLWTHLERQKGGIGMRGPGETEIENTSPEELESMARGPQLSQPKIKPNLRRPEDLEPVTRKPSQNAEIPSMDREIAQDSESLS
mgnify:CR=1 FL=1